MPTTAKHKRVVHQKAKGPIDPSVGHRVRELRAAREMTQADLAGPDFSKGFISLLETGRTRISLRAAHVLAGRLGVDVTDLLSGQTHDRQDAEFMLLRAEQELRSGNTDGAREIASKWAPRTSGILRARFRRLEGRSLVESARSPEALALLEEALRTFRSLGAKEFVARTLYDLARANARVEVAGEAVRYALEAEQAIGRGDVIDRTLELDIHQFLASTYFAIGDIGSAQARAERGRSLAEDTADPAALAKLYQSLSLSRFEQGDKELALVYARKGADLFDTLGTQEKLAETWNTIGWLFVERGQLGEASKALDRAEALAAEHKLDRLSSFIELTRAEVDLARGRAVEARDAAAAIAARPKIPSRLVVDARLIAAKATAAAGDALPAVRKAFDAAVRAAKDSGPRARARVHQAYADALSARKQPADAYAEARKALDLVGPKI